ncbi:MAG TPA: 2,3-bisphosphoglycerate-independent phosphoglycerate mutase, partial [Ignisphaera sp.]|nr:2,3-bisphosphoglycerate-independent phosphoglycerate mutase [Ignisphaera sp.]
MDRPSKYIVLVLDGVADGLKYIPTSLELARTPALDSLAKNCICGGFYPIDKEIAPESDAAVFSILGYNPHEIHVGRGLLEALGAGLDIVDYREVAFRANFATIDSKTKRIIDRRVGRSLTTQEAIELAKALDGMKLEYEGYARVVATVGHRAVVIIGSRKYRLSADISNIDPAYGRKDRVSIALRDYSPYIPKCKPLIDSKDAEITCRLVEEFIEKAIEILDKHPINLEREKRGLLKGNAILLRDAEDRHPSIQPIEYLYNKTFGAIAEMPVEKGIAKLLKMKVSEVPPPTEDKAKDYSIRLEKTLELLNEVDVVYVHLKGPDEPGHDGDKERKVKSIELIDQFFINPLLNRIDLDKVCIIVTADHATPPEVKAHTSDPVPLIISCNYIKRKDPIESFTERECFTKGSLG